MENNSLIKVGNENYRLIKEYKDNTVYRNSLNRLASATFGFDFEEWYQLGFWSDRYRPYSLVHNDTIVSNLSVNPMEFLAEGELHRALQIGTVMTEAAYRGRGLSRTLMNIVLDEYEKEYDLIYLYANDSVLEFYPRFGFVRDEEYEHSGYLPAQPGKYSFRKLNMKDEKEKELLLKLVRHARPSSGYAMLSNPGLIMFYLNSFLSDHIYYCDALSLAAICEYEADTLKLLEVFSEKVFDLKEIIASLGTTPGMKVSLGFTPLDTAGFACKPLRESGTTFFVRGNNFLKRGRFPELSHA